MFCRIPWGVQTGPCPVTTCPQGHCSFAWVSCVHPPATTAAVHDGAGSGPDGHGWPRWGRITCHRLHSWANATGSILGPDEHALTRPQSEDSTKMPQDKFLGPQEPEIRLCEACPDQDTLEDKGDSPRMCTVSPVCDTVDARDMARFSDVQRLW